MLIGSAVSKSVGLSERGTCSSYDEAVIHPSSSKYVSFVNWGGEWKGELVSKVRCFLDVGVWNLLLNPV